MKNYQLIIFDLDGTLVKDQTTEPLPDVVEKLRSLDCFVAVATNQGGVGLRDWMETKGFGDPSKCPTRDESIVRIRKAMDNCELHNIPWRVCFAYQSKSSDKWWPETNAEEPSWNWYHRKPNPGMLLDLVAQFGGLAANTLFVGDMETDRQAAENAGCDFMWAKDFFGWE